MLNANMAKTCKISLDSLDTRFSKISKDIYSDINCNEMEFINNHYKVVYYCKLDYYGNICYGSGKLLALDTSGAIIGDSIQQDSTDNFFSSFELAERFAKQQRLKYLKESLEERYRHYDSMREDFLKIVSKLETTIKTLEKELETT